MLLKKEVPLLKGSIIHSIPGRIRIGCRALKYLKGYENNLEKKFMKIKFINNVKVNPITGNALIKYDNSFVNEYDITAIFEEVISNYSLIAFKAERAKNNAILQDKSLQEDSVSDIVKRLAITTGVIAYSAIKPSNSLIGSSLGWYKKFATVPAIASIYLTKSLFKTGIGNFARTLRPNADTLTITSIIASILTGKDKSALTIILLSDIAEFMTIYTMKKTRDSIKNMLNLNEEYVWKQLADGTVKKVKVDQIKKDDLVVIHTGEKICVDGIVKKGQAVVDQAAVTGEFMPEVKNEGSKVFAGTIVKNGNIVVSTEKAGDDTVVSRIINLVEDAACQKSNIQNYADKFSSYLIPLNFLFSGITYAATKSAVRALNMLVIDYSCGIKLSTATAFSAAINTAVKNGVLIKGGNYIEALSESDTLVLDKTGTLTEGKPQVTNIEVAEGISKNEVIELAAAAEETSSHPMAIAILTKLKLEGLTIPEHDTTITHVARGVETVVNDEIIRVGNKPFLQENQVELGNLGEKAENLKAKGNSVIYVAKGTKTIGILTIQDKMRDNMKKSLNNLRSQGIDEIMLLTGDLKGQAEIVANKMGVDTYEAELLPEDKAKIVLKVQSNGSRVIMVGDGINDAPALAYSDVGIALGGGTTDIAMETSDITIQSDNPMMLPATVDLSKKTMKVVKENFGLVISINTLGLLLSAAGVLPVFWGAVLHNSSTIFVVSNSLRLLFFKAYENK